MVKKKKGMWCCGRAGISAHNSYGTKYWHRLVWSMGHRPRWGIPTTFLGLVSVA